MPRPFQEVQEHRNDSSQLSPSPNVLEWHNKQPTELNTNSKSGKRDRFARFLGIKSKKEASTRPTERLSKRPDVPPVSRPPADKSATAREITQAPSEVQPGRQRSDAMNSQLIRGMELSQRPPDQKNIQDLKDIVDKIARANSELSRDSNSALDRVHYEWNKYQQGHYNTKREAFPIAARNYLLNIAKSFPDSRPKYTHAALEKIPPVASKDEYRRELETGIKQAQESVHDASLKDTLMTKVDLISSQVKYELSRNPSALDDSKKKELIKKTTKVSKENSKFLTGHYTVEPDAFPRAAHGYLVYVHENLPHLHEPRETLMKS